MSASVEPVSDAVRRQAGKFFSNYVIGATFGFGTSVGRRIEIVELKVSLARSKAKTICKLDVQEDMLDVARGVLHPGCSAYLMDMCTALPYITLRLAQEEAGETTKFAMAPFAPSQLLDIKYHHPASLGTRLKVIGHSVTHMSSVLTVRGEIWDIDNCRLVASATHIKVMPKAPPLAAKGLL